MSGGCWGYSSDHVAEDIYSPLLVDYGEDGFRQSKQAAALNPLEDREISEIVWDVLCLLHSYDWYVSGDTGEEQYRADVKTFKEKWLGKPAEERLLTLFRDSVTDSLEKIFVEFGYGKEG